MRLPAARLEQLFRPQRGGREAAHRVAEAARHAREDLGIAVVRRRLDDRLRAFARIPRLEDPRADEDAVGTELHAQGGVGGGRDPAGGERHDGQTAVLRDPAHELDRRLEILRLGVQLVGIHCARMSAGTLSSGMTATAPASSAIRACSAVVTSMITPPFSISARPLLTRIVPISVTRAILLEARAHEILLRGSRLGVPEDDGRALEV